MTSPILAIRPLGFPWETQDPFLFCVHHDDAYPRGNDIMGPAASLAGRDLGQDFDPENAWRMYHGEEVPGFPGHPHRGFETVTLVRQGLIDHSDSLGAMARFGGGDVQWMTAGRGIVHAEMFPLVHEDQPNPLELFQIWLNLPKKNKLVEPHFSMLWNQGIPNHIVQDDAGRSTQVRVVAGSFAGVQAPTPPPKSWANEASADVAIWTLKLDPKARWTLPAGQAGSNRTLYLFRGDALTVAGEKLQPKCSVWLRADAEVTLEAGDETVECLLLQGKPIGEPVVQYGPFVMNTKAEIQQAFIDYQTTRFGGWPYESEAPVHPRDAKRFAKHADGRVEHPEE